jgi:hypothetical protein
MFYKGNKSRCRPCDNIRRIMRVNTPRGFIIKMVGDAKRNARCRQKKRNGIDNSGDCEDDLLSLFIDIIKEQNGRCAITGIPLVYKQNHIFAVSADRIDNNKGYVKGNVKMIITPLNTPNNK